MTENAEFWNKLADKYSRQPVGNPDSFERKIAITQSRMKPEDTVLDIGCGTGSLALRLAETGAQIHGLDLSQEMIRIAEDKAQAKGASNVRFHVGPFNPSFTAFSPGTLDGVCAYSLLHLVEDRAAALAHIYRLLKPGGFFIASTVCLKESWAPFGVILPVMRWFGQAPEVQLFTKQTLADEIEKTGFVEVAQPDVGAKPMVGFTVAEKPTAAC